MHKTIATDHNRDWLEVAQCFAGQKYWRCNFCGRNAGKVKNILHHKDCQYHPANIHEVKK